MVLFGLMAKLGLLVERKKMIKIITSIDKNGGISKDNYIPWTLNKHDKTLKKLSKNNCLVMGRKTFESISKPFKNRINIILTKDEQYDVNNNFDFYRTKMFANNEGSIHVANDVSEVLDIVKRYKKDLFVYGGGKTYRSFIPLADCMYVAFVDVNCDCDVSFVYNQKFLKSCDEKNNWKFVKTIFEKEKNDKNQYNSKMLLFKRTN
jgi:dihydrofolate reductase